MNSGMSDENQEARDGMSPGPAPLPRLLRSFRRFSRGLLESAKLLTDSEDLQFSLSSSSSHGIRASFDESDSLIRYAAMLRPFMKAGTDVELRSFWQRLSGESGLVSESARDSIAKAFEQADRLPCEFVVNGKTLTARDVYFAYAEGEFFDESAEAKKLLEEMSVGPTRKLVQFLFHSACRSYSQLVFAIRDVVLAVEQANSHSAQTDHEGRPCIYCLASDGGFKSEEHVIPEAFGVDELVLHGVVCDRCNNQLSNLDQFLAEFEPLSLLRVWNVPLTKSGKFPRSDFGDYSLQKVRPREMLVTSRARTGSPAWEELPDGRVRLSLTTKTRRPVDARRLGRALFKIGLGLVAHDKGPQYACEARFNAARDFIFGRAAMPNHLIVPRKATPNAQVAAIWQTVGDATVVVLNFFGVAFNFNLEPTAFGLTAEYPEGMFDELWLGEPPQERTVSGAVTGSAPGE